MAYLCWNWTDVQHFFSVVLGIVADFFGTVSRGECIEKSKMQGEAQISIYLAEIPAATGSRKGWTAIKSFALNTQDTSVSPEQSHKDQLTAYVDSLINWPTFWSRQGSILGPLLFLAMTHLACHPKQDTSFRPATYAAITI